jgi:transcriptional regulator with XRE-family HTH domain
MAPVAFSISMAVNRAYMDLGKQIKRCRTVLGLTQTQLAKKSRVTQSFIAQVETGMSNPSLATIRRLAKAVGLTVSDLLR